MKIWIFQIIYSVVSVLWASLPPSFHNFTMGIKMFLTNHDFQELTLTHLGYVQILR